MPEHALKKTLGPVSLTALGIGLLVGFVLFLTILAFTIANMRFARSAVEMG